ncbi:MAG: hypothetical protein A3E01_18440 [Gammaproteobacteria bacterium RIFCSPHIGHO2_12_FULL_63_22]|nr:MAG: hypothetical protein A3E01_18440 [Gammaproteobacteria bacterium RIFCSPHIGHO2_12_FULL_63_22]
MEPQTATPDAQPAASSPAPVSAQSVIDSLSHEERSSWQETGEFPDRIAIGQTPKDAPAASSPATPAEQAASTDASPAPASEPGKPATKPKGAAARSAELDPEIQTLQDKLKLRRALREELATLDRPKDGKPGATTSDASPSAKGEWDGSDPRDPKPADTDFESYAEYLDHRDAWNERRFERKSEARQHATDQQARLSRTGSEAMERVRTYATAHPGFTERVDPQLIAIPLASAMPPDAVRPANVLAEAVIDSPATGELLDHFSTPQGQKDWQRLIASPTRSGMLRELGRIEARMDAPASSVAAAPAPKTVSSAPTPPMTLGARTADTADPIDVAIKRKDTAAYIREANRRDLAAMGL